MRLIVDPHGDDATLFCSFTIQRENLQVVIVLDSYTQVRRGHTECDVETRRLESMRALERLGAGAPAFLGFSDAEPPSEAALVRTLSQSEADEVWLPAEEVGGHEQHNLVARAGLKAFEGSRIHRYLTYTRTNGKSTNGIEVKPTGKMVRRKLEALACYRTQLDIDALGCWPHFMDLKEYLAP